MRNYFVRFNTCIRMETITNTGEWKKYTVHTSKTLPSLCRALVKTQLDMRILLRVLEGTHV